MRRASHAHQEQVDHFHTTDVAYDRPGPEHIPLEFELETLRQSLSRAPEPQSAEFSLPPTDQGKDAWMVLVTAFFVEAFTWGLPFTFGVFQEYYSDIPEFGNASPSVAIIGTVTYGILYLGIMIVAIALTAASFATSVWQLILTQGVLYSIGGSMLYYPIMLLIDEWFVRRKSFAFGIAWAATGLSGVVFPFLVSWTLEGYSFRTTLRILAVMNVVAVVPSLYFAKPRVPVTTVSVRPLPNFRFVLDRGFLASEIGNIFEGLGYFMPGLFLPTYTRLVGCSNGTATASVVLLNSGTFVGILMIGFLGDRIHAANSILITTVGGTLSVLLLWGFAGSAAVICLFAFVYGVFAGGFGSTWIGVVKETSRLNPQAETTMAYAALVAGRGIGSVASGPLSDVLLKAGPLSRTFSYGYGSDYGTMIVFAGVSNAMGSLGFVARRLGWW